MGVYGSVLGGFQDSVPGRSSLKKGKARDLNGEAFLSEHARIVVDVDYIGYYCNSIML
jgi:hypothetical protein